MNKFTKLIRELPGLVTAILSTDKDPNYVIALASHYTMRKLHILTGGYSTQLIAHYLYPKAKSKKEWTRGIEFIGNFKDDFDVDALKRMTCFARKFGQAPEHRNQSFDEVFQEHPGIARIDVADLDLYADYNLVRFILQNEFEDRARDIIGEPLCAVNISAWWSTPTDKGQEELSSAAQMWHRDVDHLREIKFFCFATDVSIDNGPFQYVERSHLPSLRSCSTSDGRMSDDWIKQKLRTHDVISVIANAGDVFVADTHGLHRGRPVLSGRRLVLQLHFSYSIFGAESLARPRIKLDQTWPSFKLWAEALRTRPNVWRYLFDAQSLTDIC